LKKKILIIFGVLIIYGIVYFFYTNKRIEGIWINHYNISTTEEYSFPGRDILRIKNLKFHSFNYATNGGLIEQKYFLFGKSLRLWPTDSKDFSIPKISKNKDSLTLTFYGEQQRIYKKISDTLKNDKDFKFDFTNKAFRLESKSGVDTIHFDSELTYNRRNDHPYRNWHTGGWKTVEIDDFDFLLFASATPVIIKEKNDDILLYVLADKNDLLEVKLVEIQLDTVDSLSLEHYKKYYVDG
jgi:hypothetical protein